MTMKQRVGIQYQVNKNIKSNLVNQGKVLLAAYLYDECLLNVCEKLFTKDSRRILCKKFKLLFVSRRATALPKSRRFLSGLKRTVLRQTP